MTAMADYVIIIEPAGLNFAAYAPDVPGCVAAADTVEETIQLMQEALVMHFDLMREMGDTIPTPSTRAAEVTVAL